MKSFTKYSLPQNYQLRFRPQVGTSYTFEQLVPANARSSCIVWIAKTRWGAKTHRCNLKAHQRKYIAGSIAIDLPIGESDRFHFSILRTVKVAS
jgi:hypothetical protein